MALPVLGGTVEMTLGGPVEMTLGVMGGGQLGRMFVHAAQRMGFFTAVLDPDPLSPAGRVSHHHIQAAYTDPDGLQQLAQRALAITTEFENVPAPALISTAEQLAAVPAGLLPGILKTARMGYDGKGQLRVRSHAELAQAWDDLQQVPCVLEKMLPLQLECSVIVARNAAGDCVHLPVQRNLHREGILAVTEVFDDNLPAALAGQAIAAARSIAEGLAYVGVLCVEFFVLEGEGGAPGQLVVNEMAPRPHNSGHYSEDACDVSQFELQVRTLAGLPLTQPRQHSPCIMLNLLGDLWPEGGVPPWPQVLALPGVHLHLYGKQRAARGRKMGHLNITGESIGQVRETALQAARMLGIAAF